MTYRLLALNNSYFGGNYVLVKEFKSGPDLISIEPRKRIQVLDQLRGVALFAIFMCNLPLLTGKMYMIINYYMDESHLDRPYDFVWWIFGDSARPLFAFMFGISMMIIFKNSQSKSSAPLLVLFRRMFFLLIFGAIHLFVVWNGDILFMYACDGFLLLLFVPMNKWFLLLFATLTVGFTQEVSIFLTRYLFAEGSLNYFEAFMEKIRLLVAKNLGGGIANSSVFEVLWREFKLSIRHLSYFLFGMFFYKSGLLQVFIRQYKTIWIMGLLLLGVGLYAKDQYKIGSNFVFYYGYPIFCFFISLAVMMIVISLGSSNRLCFLTRPFTSVGRMAFSNYLIQSLVFTSLFIRPGETIFKKIGFFEEQPFSLLFVIGLLFFSLQMLFSTIWLHHFQYGPFEYLWRWGTNWQRPAWKKQK